jgi:hypothetical protein
MSDRPRKSRDRKTGAAQSKTDTRNNTTSTIWEVKPDPTSDPLLPLLDMTGEVTEAIAAEMVRDGQATHCGECGKPFTLARKRRSVGRVRHLDPAGLVYSTTWVFCGRCQAQNQRNGGKVSDKLMEQAREAAKAGMLAMMPAKGSA